VPSRRLGALLLRYDLLRRRRLRYDLLRRRLLLLLLRRLVAGRLNFRLLDRLLLRHDLRLSRLLHRLLNSGLLHGLLRPVPLMRLAALRPGSGTGLLRIARIRSRCRGGALRSRRLLTPVAVVLLVLLRVGLTLPLPGRGLIRRVLGDDQGAVARSARRGRGGAEEQRGEQAGCAI
jgi:hypothetical protein